MMATLEMGDLGESTVSPIIHIKDAHKSYGTNRVLNGLDLSVNPGTIYGLLGPSGCGKTTLMGCIIGSFQLDSGTMVVDLKNLNDIGFMPQEISLHSILSIKEIMTFFGYLYRMEADEIRRRIDQLSDMLSLPPSGRCISSMSGGQQRRVSMAVALLHDPKVLILDEPTVGLDPLICKNIWDRLKEMSLQGKTIVVTTHYIEEARQADMIGLMREGRMLTQDSPTALLQKHNVEYLEDVFLALCYRETKAPTRPKLEKTLSSTNVQTFDKSETISVSRIKATLLKNFYTSKRNFGMTFFGLLLPLVLDMCTKVAFGQDPYNLPIAIVNQEIESSLENCPRGFGDACMLEDTTKIKASCVFIDELRDRTFQMTEYTNYEDALLDFRKNRNRAIVIFRRNFTESIVQLILEPDLNAAEDLVKSSTIEVELDVSEKPIRDQMQKDMAEASEKLLNKTVQICTDLVQPGTLETAVKIKQIYGEKDWTFFVGFQIGFNIVVILFCSMVFSAATMLDEKMEGSLDRVLFVGVTMWEITISHILQHSISAVIYSIEIYFLTYHVFDQPLAGSPHLVIFLFFFTAMTGVFLGGAVGLLTEHLTSAVNGASGINFAIVCLTGMIWPIEGAHKTIRPILPYLPLTSTIKALRDIALKGYSLENPELVGGFAQIIFWMAFCLILEIMVIKTQKGAWSTKK